MKTTNKEFNELYEKFFKDLIQNRYIISYGVFTDILSKCKFHFNTFNKIFSYPEFKLYVLNKDNTNKYLISFEILYGDEEGKSKNVRITGFTLVDQQDMKLSIG